MRLFNVLHREMQSAEMIYRNYTDRQNKRYMQYFQHYSEGNKISEAVKIFMYISQYAL